MRSSRLKGVLAFLLCLTTVFTTVAQAAAPVQAPTVPLADRAKWDNDYDYHDGKPPTGTQDHDGGD